MRPGPRQSFRMTQVRVPFAPSCSNFCSNLFQAALEKSDTTTTTPNSPVITPSTSLNGLPSKQSSDGDNDSQTENEAAVADLLLMDVDRDESQPAQEDDDIDMELEDEDESVQTRIQVGGLAPPVFMPVVSEPDPPPIIVDVEVRILPDAVGLESAQMEEVVVEKEKEEEEEDSGPPPLGHFKVGSLAYLTDKNLVVTPPASPELVASTPRTGTPSGSGLNFRPVDAADSEAQSSSGVLTPGMLPTLFAATEDVFVLRTDKMDRETRKKLVGRLREFGVDVRGGAGEDNMDVDVDDGDGWAGLPPRALDRMMSGVDHSSTSTSAQLEPDLLAFSNSFIASTSAAFRDTLSGISWAPSTPAPASDSSMVLSPAFPNSLLPHDVPAASPAPDSQSQTVSSSSTSAQTFSSLIGTELAAPLCAALTEQLTEAILRVASGAMREAMEVASEEACVEWEWRGRVLERERRVWDSEGDDGAGLVEQEQQQQEEDGGVIQHPLHHLLLRPMVQGA
ncbi:hypothetical protein C8F01DRAFT_346771 [Mycena amicta]|nr:hypothetical protein C8F01DRAFT_346771 [Mycena amicta]